jgi:hypothetical protein
MAHEVVELGVVLVLHVHAQVAGAGEDGFALLAHEALVDVGHGRGGRGLLAVDALLMPTEVVVACEVFRAVGAVVGLQFRVHQRVAGEVVASVEGVLALRAFVGFGAVDLLLRLLQGTGCAGRVRRRQALAVIRLGFILHRRRRYLMLIEAWVRMVVSHVLGHFAEQAGMLRLRMDDLGRYHLLRRPERHSFLKRIREKQQVGRFEGGKKDFIDFYFFLGAPGTVLGMVVLHGRRKSWRKHFRVFVRDLIEEQTKNLFSDFF